jgi:hypothetical protein
MWVVKVGEDNNVTIWDVRSKQMTSTLNPRPSTLTPQPSTRNLPPPTLNLPPSTINPNPSGRGRQQRDGLGSAEQANDCSRQRWKGPCSCGPHPSLHPPHTLPTPSLHPRHTLPAPSPHPPHSRSGMYTASRRPLVAALGRAAFLRSPSSLCPCGLRYDGFYGVSTGG